MTCRFADKHRRLLNTLLRSNASLLQGSLQPMLKVPRLIEFDNKRAYFRTRIHSTGDDHRRYGSLRIAVRRSHVFEDSFHQMRMRYDRPWRFAALSALQPTVALLRPSTFMFVSMCIGSDLHIASYTTPSDETSACPLADQRITVKNFPSSVALLTLLHCRHCCTDCKGC